MKKNILTVLSIILLLGSAAACGSKENDGPKKAPAKKEAKVPKDQLPNYRYVDLDSLLSRYNLAKDYNEEMLRIQGNLEQEAKKHDNAIQAFANQMQNKMQNNSYLSRESYEQDEKHLNSLQANAQKTLGAKQQEAASKAAAAQQAVNDSIQEFIKEYNKKHGYDAIFFKAATLYIDEDLDITDEVVEGLNARYNKVKK